MNLINSKTIVAVVASGLVAGTGTYLVQQRESNRLRHENLNLMAQRENAARERDAAQTGIRTTQDELERLRSEQAELLRLRGEVGQLRRQVASQKAQASQPPAAAKAPEPAATPPGAYITTDQLTNVGYGTPEAALQTVTWAMMKGTYEQVMDGSSPEILASDSKDAKAREGFTARQKIIAPLFKGMQIVAQKALSDGQVELKVKLDADPIPGQQRQMPPFMIQPMVKVGEVWKISGSTRGHDDAWEKSGQIQNYAP